MDLRLFAALIAVLSAGLFGITLGWWGPHRTSPEILLEVAHREVHRTLATDESAHFDDHQVTSFPEAGLVCGGRLLDARHFKLASADYNFSGDLGAGLRGDRGTPWVLNQLRCKLRGQS